MGFGVDGWKDGRNNELVWALGIGVGGNLYTEYIYMNIYLRSMKCIYK
jgi:hypothetical protein